MKKETEKISLFNTEYNGDLRKLYEEDCRESGYEPEPDGEWQWWSDLVWDIYWPDFKYEMKQLSKKYDYFLCVGSCGLWNGRSEGGAVSDDLLGLIECIAGNCDDFEITLEDGYLSFSGYHHDGSNYYEIYALNKRANRTIDSYGGDLTANRELNEKLCKPYYFAKIEQGYGC